MPKDPNIQFLPLIKETFEAIFNEYGFALQENVVAVENEYVVIARKDDIELVFYLGGSSLFYYPSLSVKLSGELAVRATPQVNYRNLDVTVIAKCLDPNYKRSTKAAQTNIELKELIEWDKEDLLKYCKDILFGDVSKWQDIVECITKKS